MNGEKELEQQLREVLEIKPGFKTQRMEKIQALLAEAEKRGRIGVLDWIKANCSMSIHPGAPRHNAYTVYEHDVEELKDI